MTGTVISVERSNAVIGERLAERFPNGFKRARQSETRRYDAKKRYMDILKACNVGELATAQDLGCDDNDFLGYANMLVEKNLLRQKQGAEHECDTLGYLVTPEGADLLSKGRAAQEALARIVESVAAGTTRGALSQ